MGRGRVELRRIEERARRQVSFAKRRKGLLKKAAELAVLCDAHVALLVFSPFDGNLHHFAAPSTIENIMERHQNFSAAQKSVHDKSLLEQSNSKGFQVPRATTDGRLNSDDVSIDESSISKLTAEQISQIERKLEDALRRTMARKTQLTMDRIAGLQEKGKSLPEERNFMDTTLLLDKEKVAGDETGSQRSGEVDGLLLSLSIGAKSIGANCNGIVSHGHGLGDGDTQQRRELPINLNI
uniref:MADS64 n=1 Tax=Dendrocalamus latiflorus TaxID=257763 RepID=A0A3S6JTX7_DENLA|nr:MADS64 [Dendrocalamus latiflorus]